MTRTDDAVPPRTEQPSLPGLTVPAPRRRRAAGGVEVAAEQPVARLVLELTPPHLDRLFDYAVPATLADDAVEGARVRVRFAGKLVSGYIVERADDTDHVGELSPLRAVMAAEATLTPEVWRLAEAVAARYAGTRPDVLRLAIPPRHARVESEEWPEPQPAPPPRLAGGAWAALQGGPALLNHLAAGHSPRAAWTALPGSPAEDGDGTDWAAAIAQSVTSCLASGRGAVVVVPTSSHVTRVTAALEALGVPAWTPALDGGYVTLRAEDGPAPRYRAFLAALRGRAHVVVGTRAAAFAPVARLGLLVCWQDGDSLHAEPRAPYPHVREVLALRSEQTGAGLLLGSFSRSTAVQRLVEQGWVQPVAAARPTVRERTARVRALTSQELAREGPAAHARIPPTAHRAVLDALARGPVLVQVPRRGYVPVVACSRCRAAASCARCHGPLGLHRDGPPSCSWCGTLAHAWRCSECGADGLRSVRVGSERTAEELGRAFPGVRIRQSGSGPGVLDDVPGDPAIIVATPGAEPVADGGYPLALLLDAAVLTGRWDLFAAEDAVRRWFEAAALVRPAGDGGQVLLVGDGAPVPMQALVRWDPAGFAARELEERRTLQLPPAVRVATVTGTRDAVGALVGRVELPPGAQVYGPVPVPISTLGPTASLATDGLDEPVRTMIRVGYAGGAALAAGLRASLAVRSARREGGVARVVVDPRDID